MEVLRSYLDTIAHYLGEPIPLAIALVLGAIAVSGKFSVTATQALLFLAWLLVLFALRNHSILQIVLWALISAAVLIALAIWFRPEVVPLNFGEIIPRRTLLFSSGAKDAKPILEIGTSGTKFVWSGPQGQAMFQFIRDDQILIERIRGRVKVSTVIRDREGKIVAELVRNQWRVAIHGIYDRNYSDDAVEVKDSDGVVVLQVKALPDRIQLQGIWRGPNGSFFALSNPPKGAGGLMTIRPEHGNPNVVPPKIPPMFKYPSERFFSQLAD